MADPRSEAPVRPRSVLWLTVSLALAGLALLATGLWNIVDLGPRLGLFAFLAPGVALVAASIGLNRGAHWSIDFAGSALTMCAWFAFLAGIFFGLLGVWVAVALAALIAVSSMALAFRLRGADVQTYRMELHLHRTEQAVAPPAAAEANEGWDERVELTDERAHDEAVESSATAQARQ